MSWSGLLLVLFSTPSHAGLLDAAFTGYLTHGGQLLAHSSDVQLACNGTSENAVVLIQVSSALGRRDYDPPCSSGLVLPATLRRYEPLAKSLLPASEQLCWTVSTFDARDTSDPLLAYLHPADATVRVNAELLRLLPAEPPALVLRWYEQLQGGLRGPEDPWLTAKAFIRTLASTNEPISRALECVACIVLGSFASLAIANFGGVAAGCVACGALHLGAAACTKLLQSVLYLVIALLPAIAFLVFEACKSLCVTSTPALALKGAVEAFPAQF